jgi:hypothetical protein
MALSPAALFNKADEAGKIAAESIRPVPMVIKGYEYEPVMDGVCGFAWVNVPGNVPFGRYLKERGARKGYPKGINLWISAYGQSYERKMAYARAFAAVLQENGVPQAYASGRLD